DDALITARALVLHDLEATRAADPETVSALEAAVTTRRWWTSQWEEGKQYVAGLIAQDVQDALLEQIGRWPLCRACDHLDPHALYIHPELGGPDPTWVCETSGIAVAPLGSLPVWHP
ncbi:MAG TPA: hypothetical protein VGD51_01115, partial [Nocardioidaceae bacterium]